MVEDPKATQVANIEEINQETMQEFLQKTSLWDFYDITKDEYMNKSDNDKKRFNCKVFQLYVGRYNFVICFFVV